MSVYQKTAEAYAKINLFLRIEGVREDGYHYLSTLMQSVSLSDTIEIMIDRLEPSSRKAPKITLVHDAAGLSPNKKNTMFTAADAFLKKINSPPVKVSIVARKRIPAMAGLGGGSSDAATVLRILNEGFSDILSHAELSEIASGIGADVSFFIDGQAALCEGVGERITPIKSFVDLPVLIIIPPKGIATPEAYAAYDRESRSFSSGIREESDVMRTLLADNGSAIDRLTKMIPSLYNDLQEVAIGIVPKISEILAFFKEQHCLYCAVSGSGSSVFGIFRDPETRDRAKGEADKIYKKGYSIVACQTIE
ncbi:MAG: 4-(cytidine 5'-diphospho)-2-C-methyl-D-erythritol kinase [Clostridiales bacterium]|nr:4-(cytidine 5'-diphospho)-2-C-methyl-D-erythritol kinase [Clostridiales bacterium]